MLSIPKEDAIAAINESNIMYGSDADYALKFNSVSGSDSMSFEPCKVFDGKNGSYLVFYSKKPESAEEILSDKLKTVSNAEEALVEIKKPEEIDDLITIPALKDVSVEEIEKFLSNFEYKNKSFIKLASPNSSMKIIPRDFESYLNVYASTNESEADFFDNLIESSAKNAKKQSFTNNQDAKKYFLDEIFKQLSDKLTDNSFPYAVLIIATDLFRIDNFKIVDKTDSNIKDPNIINPDEEITEKNKVFLPFFDISDSAVAEDYFLSITKQNQDDDWSYCLQLTIDKLEVLLQDHSMAKIKAKYEKRISFTDFNKMINQKFSKKLQVTDSDFIYKSKITVYDLPYRDEFSDFDNFKVYLKYLVSNGLLNICASDHEKAVKDLLWAIDKNENMDKFKEHLKVTSPFNPNSKIDQSVDSSDKSQNGQNEYTAANGNGNIIVILFIVLIIIGGIVGGSVYFFYFYQKPSKKYQRW